MIYAERCTTIQRCRYAYNKCCFILYTCTSIDIHCESEGQHAWYMTCGCLDSTTHRRVIQVFCLLYDDMFFSVQMRGIIIDYRHVISYRWSPQGFVCLLSAHLGMATNLPSLGQRTSEPYSDWYTYPMFCLYITVPLLVTSLLFCHIIYFYC